ncbi:histidine phosphatase family protein [Fibrobacter succinogenes]|uniref:histidine phosphatase family protein n=1 Tax=Fibrobacter succinogenes TaxID=833 RepID=UPI001568B472|nr:histidine phosphatase family protein [Fibrobacter succinogenes]
MGFISQKVFQARALCTHIWIFVFFASLLVACGDDSVSRPNEDSKGNPELSSKREDSKSSSSSRSHRRSSSSSVKGKVSSSSSIKIELPPEEGLDIVYVFEDGTVSGAIALDYFAKSTKISMVELNPDDAYKETKTSFTGEVKNGTYEIKKVKLQQPFVKLSVDGSLKSVLNDKYSSLTLVALGDVTSGEVFNLNMITTLEANRVLNLLSGKKISFEKAKKNAAEEIWNMFHLEAFDYDASEMIHVSDISESGAALLAATVLLQAGAGDDFAKFFKSVLADVSKDGKWDDAASRFSIADWALSNDLNDGYAAIRKTLESRMGKAAEFETHLRNFYLTELEFPECDAESAGKIFYVKNKSSQFYAAKYDDVSKSKERFVCDEQKGWKAIPDSLKDFMGDATPAKDGDVRRGAFTGEILVYDGTKKEWRKATALEKDRYFVLASNAKTFVDIQDVYESIKDDERVIFVLRHAERGDDTSKSGTLTDNGKKQSEEVGARLKKFKEDFVLGGSEFLRAHQTVMSIAKGRGQSYDTRDTIPQLNDDWYTKNSEEVEKAKSECGGGWEVTSKYAYTGAYSTGANAAYYNLAERSVELIEDVLLKKYTKEKFVLLSSHDKLMVPLVAYCSNLQIELKKYDGGKWINYLAGVAIIIDKSGNRRYVAIRGLKSGFTD